MAEMSSYTWSQLFDMVRRLGASSVQTSSADALLICQMVSAQMYSAYPWQFTLTTTTSGQIPCQNGVQDYAQPDNCYRLVKAWLRMNQPAGLITSNVPPPNDPNYAALVAAAESQAYVGANLPGYVAAQIRDLDVVKNLSVDLNPYSWVAIRQITQLGNSSVWRLTGATYVPVNQPFEIAAQYQPNAPTFSDLGAKPWFPDSYFNMATAGILYYLYKFNDDERAGTASTQNGSTAYSGQLAEWRSEMRSAAEAEREGSVDNFSPVDSLGSDSGFGGYWW